MDKIKDFYYFRKKDSYFTIGVLYTDSGNWNNSMFHSFDCSHVPHCIESKKLNNVEINNLLYPECALKPVEWTEIEKESISPADFLEIGVILEGYAEVSVFDLPTDQL